MAAKSDRFEPYIYKSFMQERALQQKTLRLFQSCSPLMACAGSNSFRTAAGRLPFWSIAWTSSSWEPKCTQALASISNPLSDAVSATATKLLASIMSHSALHRVRTTPWICQRWAKSKASSMVLWSGSSRVELVYSRSRKSETPEDEESLT